MLADWTPVNDGERNTLNKSFLSEGCGHESAQVGKRGVRRGPYHQYGVAWLRRGPRPGSQSRRDRDGRGSGGAGACVRARRRLVRRSHRKVAEDLLLGRGFLLVSARHDDRDRRQAHRDQNTLHFAASRMHRGEPPTSSRRHDVRRALRTGAAVSGRASGTRPSTRSGGQLRDQIKPLERSAGSAHPAPDPGGAR